MKLFKKEEREELVFFESKESFMFLGERKGEREKAEEKYGEDVVSVCLDQIGLFQVPNTFYLLIYLILSHVNLLLHFW